MKASNRIKILSGLLLVPMIGMLMVSPAEAGKRTDSIYSRLDRQQSSIERGIESGDLTKREVGVLRKEQREIRDVAERTLRGGHASAESRHRVERRLDQSERHIRQLSRNDEVRRDRKTHRGG